MKLFKILNGKKVCVVVYVWDGFSETNTFFFALLLKIRMGTVFLESNLELFIKSFKLSTFGDSIILLLEIYLKNQWNVIKD